MPMATSQIEQEAKNFIGKKGPNYVLHMATKEEKEYFEGIIYKKGKPFNGFVLYFNSSSLSVETYPGIPFITSGILFTIVAQVSSTVAGLATTMVVSGSPSTVHSFLS